MTPDLNRESLEVEIDHLWAMYRKKLLEAIESSATHKTGIEDVFNSKALAQGLSAVIEKMELNLGQITMATFLVMCSTVLALKQSDDLLAMRYIVTASKPQGKPN